MNEIAAITNIRLTRATYDRLAELKRVISPGKLETFDDLIQRLISAYKAYIPEGDHES